MNELNAIEKVVRGIDRAGLVASGTLTKVLSRLVIDSEDVIMSSTAITIQLRHHNLLLKADKESKYKAKLKPKL